MDVSHLLAISRLHKPEPGRGVQSGTNPQGKHCLCQVIQTPQKRFVLKNGASRKGLEAMLRHVEIMKKLYHSSCK